MLRGQSLWERVWSKIELPTNVHDCWIWTGAFSKKRKRGYQMRRPHIKLGPPHDCRKTGLVGRVVCEWFHGPAPSDCEAGHTCPNGENERCVNPLHLQWMTREQNEQYKSQRRREQDEEDAA